MDTYSQSVRILRNCFLYVVPLTYLGSLVMAPTLQLEHTDALTWSNLRSEIPKIVSTFIFGKNRCLRRQDHRNISTLEGRREWKKVLNIFIIRRFSLRWSLQVSVKFNCFTQLICTGAKFSTDELEIGSNRIIRLYFR